MIMQALADPQFLAMVLAGIAAVATVFTVAMPLIANDSLDKRMKAVAVERDRIRARERERISRQSRGSLRSRPAERIRQFVEQFKLSDWLGTETAKMQLMQAGFRGQKSEYTFLVFRLVLPIGFTLLTAFYLFFVEDFDLGLIVQLGIVIF